MGRDSFSSRARTSTTSGPFFFLLRRALRPGVPALLALLAVSLPSCAAGPDAPDAPEPAEPSLPAIRAGAPSPGAEAEGVRLLRDARAALEADSVERAREAAERVVEEHPTTPGSSEALWILARAAHLQDDDSIAASAAARLADVLEPERPLWSRARLLEGDARSATGASREAVEVYFSVRSDAEESVREGALAGVREVIRELPSRDLRELADSDPGEGWERLRAPLAAELALDLHRRGRSEDAEREAERALELGASGPEEQLARSILEDDVTVERRQVAVMAALLPSSGSPSEQRYAEFIQEGIRARIESLDPDHDLPVEFEIQDDSGAIEGLPERVASLESGGALGLVGPLGYQALEVAARARTHPIPIISPTAGRVPEDVEAVYSLSLPDPGGAEALARFAASRGLDSAVVVYARTDENIFEAERFAEEYERLGGRVLREVDYEPDATFFEEPMTVVRELRPAALVLPVPADDIELLAPQLTYFGLDTLGIRVLGTRGWSEPEVIESVENRHTDGVVVATPRTPLGDAPGWEAFVEHYESVLQKTLRSRIPALGYDAAGLLLEALSTGVRDPEAVREAMEAIERFPGATGELSVRDGRIVRTHHLVRLREGEMIPIDIEPDEGAEPMRNRYR